MTENYCITLKEAKAISSSAHTYKNELSSWNSDP